MNKSKTKRKITVTFPLRNDLYFCILKSYILIRNIKQYEPKQFVKHYNFIKLTYKYKNIAQNGIQEGKSNVL